MNYNYPQTQFQNPQGAAYTPYRTAPQYLQWNQTTAPIAQVRPVSSIEEVRACPIDFDGSVFYFPDLANRRIYTKQINMDGTALINVYELKEIPIQQDQTPNVDLTNFVTKDEMNQAITQLREAFSQAPQVQLNPISEPAPAQKAPLALNF